MTMLRSVVLSTAGVPCCTVTTLEPPLTLPGPAPVCPPLHVPWSLLRHWWPSTGAHQLSSVTRRGAEDQCVMVMLTCPTFVIHLCDNWDRCFHVHPAQTWPAPSSVQTSRLVNNIHWHWQQHFNSRRQQHHYNIVRHSREDTSKRWSDTTASQWIHQRKYDDYVTSTLPIQHSSTHQFLTSPGKIILMQRVKMFWVLIHNNELWIARIAATVS